MLLTVFAWHKYFELWNDSIYSLQVDKKTFNFLSPDSILQINDFMVGAAIATDQDEATEEEITLDENIGTLKFILNSWDGRTTQN